MSSMPRVSRVQAQPGYVLAVEFADGVAGTVDCQQLVHGPRAGVFAALRDPSTFAAVQIVHGAVTWPGELDLAPDAMHDALVTTGHWVIS